MKTVTDETLRELWQVKDDIAREYSYDVDALVEFLRLQSLISEEHPEDPLPYRNPPSSRVQTA